MPAHTRLNHVEKSLSPKQIVLLDIREARKFSDLIAYAQAVAQGKAGTGGSLCERVEAAVRRGLGGLSEEAKISRIREAQREGLFLAALALECNTSIAAREYELRLMGGLVASQMLLVSRARTGDQGTLQRQSDGLVMAENHARSVGCLLDAVAIIEREYFDGQPIQFPKVESLMTETLEMARTFAEWFRNAAGTPARSRGRGRAASGGDAVREQTPDPRAQAATWVTCAKAKTSEKMGDTDAAMRHVRSLLS